MNKEDRINRLKNLSERQNNLFENSNELTQIDFMQKNEKQLAMPLIDYSTTNFDFEIKEIEDIKKIDKSVFAKWRTADIPVMLIAGGLGTLSSVLLKDFFANLHDNGFGKTGTGAGGHSGEIIDKVPGSKQAGGFGHRWKFGHDLMNPFEIDWSQYSEIAAQSGNSLPIWLKKIFYWMRHLFQDTFSKEGLPLPGHSYFRSLFNPVNPKTREILQSIGTIKMRDVTGAGVTNLIMGSYLWGTEKELNRVLIKPNYRAFSLMLGANLVTLISGLLIPPPNTSLNWGTIPVIGYYSFQLIKLEKKLREILNERENRLLKNDLVLLENERNLKELILLNDEIFFEILKYEKEIEDYYIQVISRHKKLKNKILG